MLSGTLTVRGIRGVGEPGGHLEIRSRAELTRDDRPIGTLTVIAAPQPGGERHLDVARDRHPLIATDDAGRRLLTTRAPVGAAGAVGSIAYDAPRKNLAIFYREAPYADGLVILGQITSDVAVLRSRARMRARIQIEQAT